MKSVTHSADYSSSTHLLTTAVHALSLSDQSGSSGACMSAHEPVLDKSDSCFDNTIGSG